MRNTSPVLLAVVAVGLGHLAGAEVIDRVLAVVNSQVVTLSDVRAAQTFSLVPATTPAETTNDVLAYLVTRQLMLSEVDRYSAPAPASALLDRRMAQIRSTFPGAAQYEQALAGTAMTEGRLRNVIADNVRIETYVDQRFGAAAQPTSEEVQRYYLEHPAVFTRDGRLAPFDDVQVQAQERLAAERRRALITDWLDRLRRRASVTTLLTPGR